LGEVKVTGGVRKNTAHKESSQEKSHVQEQGLMAGSNRQAGWGKMAQQRFWARCGCYRRGRLRKLVQAAVVSGRGGAVLELGNLSLGVSQVRSEGKMATDLEMATLLFYHSPIFSLIMMRVGAEDQELG
jgi:hypothetical protein